MSENSSSRLHIWVNRRRRSEEKRIGSGYRGQIRRGGHWRIVVDDQRRNTLELVYLWLELLDDSSSIHVWDVRVEEEL